MLICITSSIWTSDSLAVCNPNMAKQTTNRQRWNLICTLQTHLPDDDKLRCNNLYGVSFIRCIASTCDSCGSSGPNLSSSKMMDVRAPEPNDIQIVNTFIMCWMCMRPCVSVRSVRFNVGNYLPTVYHKHFLLTVALIYLRSPAKTFISVVIPSKDYAAVSVQAVSEQFRRKHSESVCTRTTSAPNEIQINAVAEAVAEAVIS